MPCTVHLVYMEISLRRRTTVIAVGRVVCICYVLYSPAVRSPSSMLYFVEV